ncbi:Histidine phosphatase superfamily [Phytophthora cactorum]|nr:Histidine phosphatase superfamily [Phytophthora cactorum]
MNAEWDCTTTSVSVCDVECRHLELSEIYLRSDDQERTLGSGQALIDGLFPVDGILSLELHRMLSWNVADISVDYINANENICPFMGHIGQLSNESPEFWAHLRDPATVEIEHHFNDVVGNFSWSSALECLSTARCNDLELPPGIDEETFTKTYHEVEARQSIFLTYNNSWYSKLAMQPLAHDMLTRLDGVLNGDPDAYKLSVTMGACTFNSCKYFPLTRGFCYVACSSRFNHHAVLAASVKENWDRLWTPFAGMLMIEVYKTKSGSHAEKLLEYELSLQSQNERRKPETPAPKYDLSFYSSKDDEELSDARLKLLTEANRAVFEVAASDVISAPHQTTDGAWRSHATVADIFDRFPSVRLSFAEFFQIAPPTAPRYYTVSSSRQFAPDAVSITLGLRKTDTLPLPRCSSYLAMLKPGDAIRASFYQSSFVFPFHDHRPIMLISAGTGIAPFRAFLQDLEHENDTSPHQHRPAYLFYGCREASVDFLYGEELQRARDDGVLDQLHVEFSGESDKPKRVHVQDALLDQSKLVARHLLADEGYVYVCGSLAMGRAVKKAIAAAILKHPEFSGGAITTQEDAEHVVTQKLAGQLIITELW